MTRAEFIRMHAREYAGETIETFMNLCEAQGYKRPSRQAIASALAKTGTRGRPSAKAKCPLCGTRVDVDECTADERERFELLCETRGYRPIDIVRAGLRVIGDFESGDFHAAYALGRQYNRDSAQGTVANTSQKSAKRTRLAKRKS